MKISRSVIMVLVFLGLVCQSIITPAEETGKPAAAGADLPPLQPEQLGLSAVLPADFPDHWLIVHDGAFFHMLDGRMIVVDPTADSISGQFRGMFNISLMGIFAQSTSRPELYTAEIFYSRGSRGARTDVLTIYDTANLKPVEEIILPTGKMYNGMPQRYAMTLIDDERLLLVFNMTPATSVTVIDIIGRRILSEISIPGCALVYPTGKRGFSSLCSNGGMLSTQLDENGQVVLQQRVDPFFNVETSPIFERPAIIGDIAYFPGFDGTIHPVNLRGSRAIPGEPWQLVSGKARKEGWRPGGIALIDTDSEGNFYILMHPEGHEGTQNEGGSQIWVVDASGKSIKRKITLRTWGLSLALTRNAEPLIAVTNADMNLDVYSVDGGHLRTITDLGLETPLIVYGVR